MSAQPRGSLVGRRRFVGLLPFTLLPAVSFAEAAPDTGCAPAALTPAQFDRMYKRLMGKWRLVPEKSTFFVGSAPKNPSSFVYAPAPDQALGMTNENGASVAKFDGQLYNAAPTIPGTMLARILHDEFTVENVLNRNGKVTARNLQYYLPDGAFALYVARDVNESGVVTPRSFMLYEKVPDSALLWWEAAKK
jgi:hypothetical protein